VHFNVNFNVFFKYKKVHLLVSEVYIHRGAVYLSYIPLCKTLRL